MALQHDPDKDHMPRCRCLRPLWSNAERENRICDDCADSDVQRSFERDEFVYYHPPERD